MPARLPRSLSAALLLTLLLAPVFFIGCDTLDAGPEGPALVYATPSATNTTSTPDRVSEGDGRARSNVGPGTNREVHPE